MWTVRRTFSGGPLRVCSRGRCSAPSDGMERLLELCVNRHFVCPGEVNAHLLRQGASCNYGPLGTELKRNMLDQWRDAVSRSRALVFGINTVSCGERQTADDLRVIELKHLKPVIEQRSSKEEIQELLQKSPSVRTNLFTGALEQFVPSLEMVNRKLPFGLAEAGLCFKPSHSSGCPTEFTQTSVVWFCSPRTSSQWLDHWARQRLKWWRKFALSPSDFSNSEITTEELRDVASRGVKILYNFPWGPEPLETLWSRGSAELLNMYQGEQSKLQCRDGRKSIPHVISISGNMDRGLVAYLFNSLQQVRKEESRLKLQRRKVLKLHPVLAPVKVALDIGRGATVELRQVCEGLLQDLQEAKIFTWPGYLDSVPTSAEQLHAKYDEMGILFSIVISENTLESGLIQVRSRDTTIKETMHISEIVTFVSKYVFAADNI